MYVIFVQKGVKMNYLERIINKFNEDDIFGKTAELTFYMMMTFFPFVILMLASFSAITAKAEEIITDSLSSFPQQAREIILYLLTEIDKNPIVIATCGILSVWSISCAVDSICKSLNKMYNIKETRGFFKVRFIGIIFAVLLMSAIILTFTFLVYGNTTVYTISKIFPTFILFGKTVRFILIYLILTICFLLIYKVLPAKKLETKDVYIGAFITSALWFISSAIYSAYTSNFSGHSIIYGGFSGIIIIITWLYLSGFLLLSGGEFNSLLYNKKHSL